MSFRCPANIISGKNPNSYNNLINNATITVDDPNMTTDGIKAINKYVNGVDPDQSGSRRDVCQSNLPYFFKNARFPSTLDPSSTCYNTYNSNDLKAILKGLTRKVAVCSSAYKSTESYTIISKLKEYFTGGTFVVIFYIFSYLIISYLGYSYITEKLFNINAKSGKTVISILSHKGDTNAEKSTIIWLYRILIFLFPVTIIGLMLTNKINVSFNSTRVLFLFSLASLVLIGFLKTVASQTPWKYGLAIILVLACAGFGGWWTYQHSGKVAEDNQEGERSDAFDLNISVIIVMALIMLGGLLLIGKKMEIWAGIFIIVLMIGLPFGLTYYGHHYKNKRAIFSFICILLPFIITLGWKYSVYTGAGINRGTSIGIGAYVAVKMAIFSGLLGLAVFQACKAGAEIERAKKLETNTSKSPYYDVTKPINGLMIVYYVMLAIVAAVIVVSAVSQYLVLNSLNGLSGLRNILRALAPNDPQRATVQKSIDKINNGQAVGFRALDWSYILSVIVIMSLVLSYNGIFSIWLPFVLIPVGLLERGIVSTALNWFTGNVSQELKNWQPVGSYLIEALIKLFTYTPLDTQQANAVNESTSGVSFIDAVGELNSVMFDRN